MYALITGLCLAALSWTHVETTPPSNDEILGTWVLEKCGMPDPRDRLYLEFMDSNLCAMGSHLDTVYRAYYEYDDYTITFRTEEGEYTSRIVAVAKDMMVLNSLFGIDYYLTYRRTDSSK